MTEGGGKCLERLIEMLASQKKSLSPGVHGSAHKGYLVNSSDEAQNLIILQIKHLLFPRVHTKVSCAFRPYMTPSYKPISIKCGSCHTEYNVRHVQVLLLKLLLERLFMSL